MALAAALVLLATLAGVMAHGPWLPLALLSAAFTGLILWAAQHDWLTRAESNATPFQRIRGLLIIAVAFLFALLYVYLTGGSASRLSFALYLPLVLAAICFGTRVGVVAGASMAFVYVMGLGWRHPPHGLSEVDWEGTLSFPLVAVAVSLLTKRNEERLLALHRHARELDTQLDMAQMMDSAIDLETALTLILLNVQKLSGCQVCAIYLKDSLGENLELRSLSGPRHHAPLRPSLPLTEARNGDFNALRPDSQARTSLCLPLTCVEGLLGMLYVGDDKPRALRPADVALLEQLARRIGFPLLRALTQQDMEMLAYSDAMTGLDNYRQFERTLQDELRRAERYGRPLSLLLLDIDHFKVFNDTLGHPAGDALLGQLGIVLRNTLRSVDRPARYGGEEFAVVCPETGTEEAHLIAERVRRAVEDTPFALTGQAGETVQVTVSVGFATCPQDAHAASDLIKRADAALYAAKRGGRNAVCGAAEGQDQRLAA